MNARVEHNGPDPRVLMSQQQIGNLQNAERCIARLQRMGLLVLGIRMSGSCTPRITIQNSPLVSQLNAAPYIHRYGPCGPENVMACPMNGCQVEWTQRGH